MTDNRNYLMLSYFDSELRNVIEWYITQQEAEFTFKRICC